VRPLKEAATSGDPILQLDEIEEVFANIEDIYLFHRDLLLMFEQRLNNFEGLTLVADILVQKVTFAETC